MRHRNRTGWPPGIEPDKLPKGCYWDKSGKGHWYTAFRVSGKLKRERIAGPGAKLSDLHRIMEQRQGLDVNCLNWLWGKFNVSAQFNDVAKKTQQDWSYCANVIAKTPSKVPGVMAGKVPLSAWTPVQVQKLIDKIATINGPSAASHCARYLRRVVNWSVLRGHLPNTFLPQRLELPKERKRRRLPERETLAALITFAQERGARQAHTKGSCPPYLWMSMVLAYRLRLRGIEVFDLSDSSLLDEGIQCDRRKGSASNIAKWHPDLRTVVDAAQAHRDALWKRQRKAVPIRADMRPLLVGEKGQRLNQNAWQNSWGDFLDSAIEAEVITTEQRFGLHDLKRRGITDTKGGKAGKMEGGGHKSAAMLDAYDFEMPIVDAAGD